MMSAEEIDNSLSLENTSSLGPLQDNSVALFLKNLTKLNIYIGLQSVLDALDIWLSAVKYVFDALNPSSGNRSAAQMYQWLNTADGFLIFIAGNIFFASFAFLGNYINTQDEKNKPWLINQFAKLAENAWPYIRDSFKGLKWTFKGTRSFLLVAQLLCKQNMVHLITPLGIVLGLVAASNRAWARGMVERRKVIQANNDSFREHVKFLNVAYAKMNDSDELEWQKNFNTLDENFKRLYQGSVLKIGNGFYYVNKDLCLTSINGLSVHGVKFLREGAFRMDFFHYKKHLDVLRENNANDFRILNDILSLKSQYLEQISNKDSNEARAFYDFPQYQADSYQAYASSLLNGILNAPYYFLGVLSLFLDAIPVTVFPYAVAICSVFMVLNVIAELYQEFDYQRRLSISQNKAKMSMIKRLITHEWDKINQLLDEVVISKQLNGQIDREKPLSAIFSEMFNSEILHVDNLPKELLERYSIQNSGTTKESEFTPEQNEKFKACLLRLHRYTSDFSQYKETLRANLVLDNQATFMQGIKNGLHIYGVFNGCLMAISTMAFLASVNLGINFLYISIAAGILFVTLSTIFTVSFTQNKNTVEPSSELSGPIRTDDKTNKNVPFWAPAKDEDIYKEERDIRPTKNLMISEQCEVFRQFMSGSKKGVKLLQTVLMLAMGSSGESERSIKALYGMVALAYGSLFSLKGLRGLMRVDNHDYEHSYLVGAFFPKSKPSQETRPSPLRASASSSSLHSAILSA